MHNLIIDIAVELLNAKRNSIQIALLPVKSLNLFFLAVSIPNHEELKNELHHVHPKAEDIHFVGVFVVVNLCAEDLGRGVGHGVAGDVAGHLLAEAAAT